MDRIKVLKTNGSLMKVESIAECSLGASLGAFCNIFDLYKAILGLEHKFLVFLSSGRLRQGLLYMYVYSNVIKTTILVEDHTYTHARAHARTLRESERELKRMSFLAHRTIK